MPGSRRGVGCVESNPQLYIRSHRTEIVQLGDVGRKPTEDTGAHPEERRDRPLRRPDVHRDNPRRKVVGRFFRHLGVEMPITGAHANPSFQDFGSETYVELELYSRERGRQTVTGRVRIIRADVATPILTIYPDAQSPTTAYGIE